MAACIGQKLVLARRLHAFGDHLQAQAVAQPDDRAHDRGVVLVGEDLAHERAVDLELVQRQLAQVGQRRVAGAEVVQRKRDTLLFQRGHRLRGRCEISHDQAFGQLQAQPRRLHAGLGKNRRQQRDEIRFGELARADVDGQRQAGRCRLALPACQLEAGSAHDPGADLDDEPAFFGDADEVKRQHDLAIGLVPAQQRFGPDHAARAVELRLVVQYEFVALQRAPQAAFEFGAREPRGLHRRVVEAKRVAPGRLGLVHRGVGLAQGRFDRVVQAAQRDHADAHRQRVMQLAQLERRRQRRNHLFGDRLGLRRRHIARILDGPDQHHELVAAQTRHHVRFAHAAFEPARHGLQQQVAGGVALAVVEVLEVVEVAEHQRAALAAAGAAEQGAAQLVEQVGAVGQVGEMVEERQPEDPRFARFALADVGADHQDFLARARHGVGRQQGPARVGVDLRAVTPHVRQFAAPFAIGQRVGKRGFVVCLLVAQQLAKALADRFVRTPAVQALGAMVPVADARGHVHRDDRITRLLQE